MRDGWSATVPSHSKTTIPVVTISAQLRSMRRIAVFLLSLLGCWRTQRNERGFLVDARRSKWSGGNR